jgi:cell division transport system ATP-binding protein
MLLAFEQVGLRHSSNREILADIDFTLPSGGFFFLTGPSGAGKSSLLRLIYGAETPTAGRISLFGRDLSQVSRAEFPELRRQIGVIFQDFRLIPHLTVVENAALPLRLSGAREEYIQRHTRELLEWVGLSERLSAYPHELSAGEQQRAAIARAVVNKPKLLLADEPTANVDEDVSIRLLHLFNELHKLGTAVILATHQQNLVDCLKKPVLRLQAGRMVSQAKVRAA